MSPTIWREGPYRFHFYSHEPNEPPHVHVERDDAAAKFWLDPVMLAYNWGFSGKELPPHSGDRRAAPRRLSGCVE